MEEDSFILLGMNTLVGKITFMLTLVSFVAFTSTDTNDYK